MRRGVQQRGFLVHPSAFSVRRSVYEHESIAAQREREREVGRARSRGEEKSAGLIPVDGDRKKGSILAYSCQRGRGPGERLGKCAQTGSPRTTRDSQG
jgi:hypothetical protein